MVATSQRCIFARKYINDIKYIKLAILDASRILIIISLENKFQSFFLHILFVSGLTFLTL